jgi:hypothetical protein
MSRSYRLILRLKKRLPKLWLFLQEAATATVEEATPKKYGYLLRHGLLCPLPDSIVSTPCTFASQIGAVEAWVPRRSDQEIEVRSSLQTISNDTRCKLQYTVMSRSFIRK